MRMISQALADEALDPTTPQNACARLRRAVPPPELQAPLVDEDAVAVIGPDGLAHVES